MSTPPFDRTVALGARLGAFRAHWIEVGCCGVRQVPVAMVIAADRRRGERTLADFLIRLRCEACGARPASAVLVEDVRAEAVAAGTGNPPRTWRLPLI